MTDGFIGTRWKHRFTGDKATVVAAELSHHLPGLGPHGGNMLLVYLDNRQMWTRPSFSYEWELIEKEKKDE